MPLSKSGVAKSHRGFESHLLRHKMKFTSSSKDGLFSYNKITLEIVNVNRSGNSAAQDVRPPAVKTWMFYRGTERLSFGQRDVASNLVKVLRSNNEPV